MKPRIFILALLFLIGCGQSNDYPNISMTTIVWQGYPSQDEYYSFSKKVSEVTSCLNNLNIISRDGEPYIVVVQNQFYCNAEAPNADGCYFDGVVYIKEGLVSPFSHVYGIDIFKHEVVHWATGLGNEYHDTAYFTDCVDNYSSI